MDHAFGVRRVVRCQREADLAVREDERAVGERNRALRALLDEDDGEPLVADLGERAEDRIGDGRGKAERRLVEEQDIRCGDERAGDGQLLLLASRERSRVARAELPDDGEELQGTLDAILVGEGVTALAGEASKLGADRVLVADSSAFKAFGVDAFLKALLKAVAASKPRLFAMAASVVGKDLGPALAAASSSALLTDVTSVAIANRPRAEEASYGTVNAR